MLPLLQANTSAEPEACEAALDSLCSLQYMTGPGILCAFAGSAGSHGQAADSSHTAHFRFTDAKVIAFIMTNYELASSDNACQTIALGGDAFGIGRLC